MKYVVMLGDGMADYPVASLGGKTPLEAANKPMMDALCKNGELGLVRTLQAGMPTGSDIANLSVLGYDPKKYYTGRSPIEALGLDIPLSDEDTVFRLNLVSISTDEPFEQKTMLDHSSDKITSEEAYALLDALEHEFGSDTIRFYRGVSYRHILIWKGIDYNYTMMPPHDILDQKITEYLPGGPYGAQVLSMMKRSYEILMAHPVKAQAAITALDDGADFVFIHVEAPDECGHDGDAPLKVKSIERIDAEILTPVKQKLDAMGEPYRILLMPDHATPIALRTHAIDPIPYVIYTKDGAEKSGLTYSEKHGAETGRVIERGYELMRHFLGRD